MTDQKHTLESLFSDAGPFDESAVIKAIFPFVTIQKSTSEIFLKESNLTNEEKVLVFALAKKLLKAKSLIKTDMITALEVHKKTGIKKGTIDPVFMGLKGKGFLVGKKEYEIPVIKIPQIIKLINPKTDNHE